MKLTIDVPQDILESLEQQWGDLSRHTIETLAAQGYEARLLSRSQVARLLGFETRMEVDEFLKKAGVYLDYTEEDLEQDRRAHRELAGRRPE